MLMPLKLKYRTPGKLYHRPWDPPEGTLTFNAGRYKSKNNNSGKADKTKTLKPRRRSYGPW